jgi:hypothetical protein
VTNGMVSPSSWVPEPIRGAGGRRRARGALSPRGPRARHAASHPTPPRSILPRQRARSVARSARCSGFATSCLPFRAD